MFDEYIYYLKKKESFKRNFKGFTSSFKSGYDLTPVFLSIEYFPAPFKNNKRNPIP